MYSCCCYEIKFDLILIYNLFVLSDGRSQSHSPLPASSPYWSPPSVAQLQTKIREEGDKIDDLLKDVGDADTSLQDQKVCIQKCVPMYIVV